MAEPKTRVVLPVQDWPGQVSNSGPMGGPTPGTAELQVNLAANVPGELSARPGCRRVAFDEES